MKFLSPIVTCIIVSAAIHIALVIKIEPPILVFPSSTGSIISVQLKDKKPHKQTNHIQPAEKNIKEIQKLAAVKKEKPVKKQTENDISDVDKLQIKSKAYIISILIEEFKQHFSYPKLAKKRNWQGEVLLSLRITTTGKIKSIQIDNSSGYNILDQAAITSMRKVETLPKIATWLKNDIELTVPVIYQLVNG